MIMVSIFTVKLQNNESKDSDFIQSSSWLNTVYIDCLNNQMPCECEKYVETYFSLSINADYKWVSICEYTYSECGIFYIKKIDNNKYGILHWQKKDSIWATIEISNDSLYLIKNDTLSKFIQSNTVKGYDAKHYSKDNVEILNKSLIARGYPTLEEIVGHDSLYCECNKWIGEVNLLSVNKRPMHWELKIENDSLFFYKETNSHRDIDEPSIIEVIKAFKW